MLFKLAIANLKGGVGKSTTTLFLAETLAAWHDLNVLVIDLDPQSNSSFMLLSRDGVNEAEASGRTLTHLLLNAAQGLPPTVGGYVYAHASDLRELRNRVGPGRVDVLPSVPRMWFVEMIREKKAYLENTEPAEELRRCLDEYLSPLRAFYDLIIFDCPPGFSSLTRAGLMSAHAVISPTIADAVSIRSLSDFVEIGLGDVLHIKERIEHYVIISKYRAHPDHVQEIEGLKRRYRVLEPYVRESVDMTHATERVRANSYRTYAEKYTGLKNDLRKLSDAVYRIVITLRG